MARVPVRIEPVGVTVWVDEGTTVLDAARAARVPVPAPCGGRGICGSCGVRVLEGSLVEPDDAEVVGLRRAPAGVRLACRARVAGPVTVRPVVSVTTPPSSVVPGAAVVSLVAGVDLGTTSVEAAIVDAGTGRELARGSVPNLQHSVGSDVLTRVSAALSGSADQLRDLAAESIAEAIVLACSRAGVATVGLARVAVAANSAMAALLAAADVSTLAAFPFSAPFAGGPIETPSAIASLAPEVDVLVVGPVGGFVGGDALAATVSAGMLGAARPAMLVDIGTNAEIVLVHPGGVVAASAAAGPAFEGGGVSCGGPAADGAVRSVTIGDDGGVALEVIGGGEPAWFAGSGLVSALASLRRAGHLAPDGLLLSEGPLERRFSRDEYGVLGMDLAEKPGIERCLRLTQLDVRSLQLAKAAVQAGVRSVLGAVGLAPVDLKAVHVAGAFGAAVSPGDLVTLGVLPAAAVSVTRCIGNAALAGATAAAIEGVIPRSLTEMGNVEVLDLALDPEFNGRLMDAVAFEPY